jgi:hypothetical protein
MAAINLLQKWQNRQKLDGKSLRLPGERKEAIIREGRSGFPLSSQDQVRKLFDQHRKYDEKKVTPRGYVHRVRGPDYL